MFALAHRPTQPQSLVHVRQKMRSIPYISSRVRHARLGKLEFAVDGTFLEVLAPWRTNHSPSLAVPRPWSDYARKYEAVLYPPRRMLSLISSHYRIVWLQQAQTRRFCVTKTERSDRCFEHSTQGLMWAGSIYAGHAAREMAHDSLAE